MSFADLKKKSSNNLQFLQKELEKTVSTRQVDERFWKPEVDASGNGYAVIRFLPAPEGSSFNLEDQEIPVESGDLIIFRGNSYHAVKPSVEGRCMIACNIIYNPKIPRSGFKKINKGF